MPRLELGDLEDGRAPEGTQYPAAAGGRSTAGYDIVAPIPSCVLMFKQELPLMFPDDPDVQGGRGAHLRSVRVPDAAPQAGLLKTDFKTSLGKVSYHVPCHLRVQNIGLKTRDVLQLVPDTTVDVIERCSGHDGTYAVKKEFRAASMKIGRPVVTRVRECRTRRTTPATARWRATRSRAA